MSQLLGDLDYDSARKKLLNWAEKRRQQEQICNPNWIFRFLIQMEIFNTLVKDKGGTISYEATVNKVAQYVASMNLVSAFRLLFYGQVVS